MRMRGLITIASCEELRFGASIGDFARETVELLLVPMCIRDYNIVRVYSDHLLHQMWFYLIEIGPKKQITVAAFMTAYHYVGIVNLHNQKLETRLV